MLAPNDNAVKNRYRCLDRGRETRDAPSTIPLPVGWYARSKVVFDFLGALVLLVPAFPLILLSAVLVKLTSPGPAFYSQTRLGRNGRRYRIHKIRTMYHNCERHTGACWAVDGDPRITPVGRFLRRTHLDELPQLWNVLRSEMSLVGPRPERPELVPQLRRAIPGYSERLLVRPGITGLAQVQLAADTDLASVARKLAYDRYYVARFDPWLDLRLIVMTGLNACGIPGETSLKLLRVPGGARVELAPPHGRSDGGAVPHPQPA